MWLCQLGVSSITLDQQIACNVQNVINLKNVQIWYDGQCQIQSCILPFFFKHPQIIKEQTHPQTWIDCSWLSYVMFRCLDPSKDYLRFSLPSFLGDSPLLSGRQYSLAFDLWECSSYVWVWADSSLMPVLKPACGEKKREREDDCFMQTSSPTKLLSIAAGSSAVKEISQHYSCLN